VKELVKRRKEKAVRERNDFMNKANRIVFWRINITALGIIIMKLTCFALLFLAEILFSSSTEGPTALSQ